MPLLFLSAAQRALSSAPVTLPSMEQLLRDWRQDAINKHQYESAIYIGDKLLALTGMLIHICCAICVLLHSRLTYPCL